MVEGRGWSQFLCLFKEIPFCISFLKNDFQGAPYDPNKAEFEETSFLREVTRLKNK